MLEALRSEMESSLRKRTLLACLPAALTQMQRSCNEALKTNHIININNVNSPFSLLIGSLLNMRRYVGYLSFFTGQGRCSLATPHLD